MIAKQNSNFLSEARDLGERLNLWDLTESEPSKDEERNGPSKILKVISSCRRWQWMEMEAMFYFGDLPE